MPLEVMLRIYFLQQWYSLSDPSAEEHRIDSYSMRQCIGIQINAIPNESTILTFRHLLEKHDIPKTMFAQVNAYLASHGLIVKQGTLVDATSIHTPPSTKNKQKRRDPEMSSTKKIFISII